MGIQNPNQLGMNGPGGNFTLGGNTTVNRLGFGAMCGPGGTVTLIGNLQTE